MCCCCCCDDDGNSHSTHTSSAQSARSSKTSSSGSVSTQPSCYYPNGMVYAPNIICDASGSASTCCGAHDDGTEWVCLTNNLCKNASDTSTKYERGGCTDGSWPDGHCAKDICADEGIFTLRNVSDGTVNSCFLTKTPPPPRTSSPAAPTPTAAKAPPALATSAATPHPTWTFSNSGLQTRAPQRPSPRIICPPPRRSRRARRPRPASSH